MKLRVLLLALALISILSCGCAREEPTDPAYVAQVDEWHAGRLERLRSDTGWLTLVGLHELKPGLNLVGSAADANVRLIDKVPSRVGVLEVGELGIVFQADAAAGVTAEGVRGPTAVTRLLLKTDAGGDPTVLSCGSLAFHVIDRQGLYFLRVKDRESPVLRDFQGIDRFPVKAKWRVPARLEGEPGLLAVPNVLGQTTQEEFPGLLVFEMDGQEYRVAPTGERGESLFLVFGDETNGSVTYGGGRFLSIEAPDEGDDYVLDFNRATNPPCVFTEFATCPLPTAQNVLPVAIEAGEKVWGGHH